MIPFKIKTASRNTGSAHFLELANLLPTLATGARRLSDPPTTQPRWFERLLKHALPFCLSLACVGVVTGGLLVVDVVAFPGIVPIVYLIPVIIAATRWGLGPAAVASIASAGAADFLFLTPLYSFRIDDPQEAIDLLLFMVVALVSSNLAARLRQETEALRRREREIQSLYEFSRRLATCFSVSELMDAIQRYLSQSLGLDAMFFAATADAGPDAATGSLPLKIQQTIAAMLVDANRSLTTLHDEATASVWLLRAVVSRDAIHGVIAVNVGRESLKVDAVEAVLEEAALTLRHMNIGTAMQEAWLYTRTQVLKDALHGTLSHELRSPLSAILGSASVLNTIPAIRDDERSHSLVEAILDEVEELDAFIGNLVSATRVTASGVRPRRIWTDPRDIVNGAVNKRARRLLRHHVALTFAEDVPLVNVDGVLVEEAFGQMLENAAKYSPPGSTITVSIQADDHLAHLSVSDQGLGITPDEKQQLGRKSFRSERLRNTIAGSGLGFWIAKTFVEANGGAIDIASPGQGLGTTATISLPVDRTATADMALLADE